MTKECKNLTRVHLEAETIYSLHITIMLCQAFKSQSAWIIYLISLSSCLEITHISVFIVTLEILVSRIRLHFTFALVTNNKAVAKVFTEASSSVWKDLGQVDAEC